MTWAQFLRSSLYPKGGRRWTRKSRHDQPSRATGTTPHHHLNPWPGPAWKPARIERTEHIASLDVNIDAGGGNSWLLCLKGKWL